MSGRGDFSQQIEKEPCRYVNVLQAAGRNGRRSAALAAGHPLIGERGASNSSCRWCWRRWKIADCLAAATTRPCWRRSPRCCQQIILSGLVALGTKLRDSSVLGRELPLVGSAIGTRYDPAAALGAVFSQLSGSFTNVNQLAAALDSIPDVDITQAPIDTAGQLELRLQLATQTTITAPLDDAFGPLHLDLNGAVDISIGLIFKSRSAPFIRAPSPMFYVDATSDQLVVNASIMAPHLNATARLGFTDIMVANGSAAFGGKFSLDLLDPGNGNGRSRSSHC